MFYLGNKLVIWCPISTIRSLLRPPGWEPLFWTTFIWTTYWASTHLIPGVKQHDIIGSQVWLSEVSRNFFNLRRRTRHPVHHHIHKPQLSSSLPVCFCDYHLPLAGLSYWSTRTDVVVWPYFVELKMSGTPSSRPEATRIHLRRELCKKGVHIIHHKKSHGRHSPGSLPSATSVGFPPSTLTTYFAATISSSLAPAPFHTNTQSDDFSTNTSLVFKLDADGSTYNGSYRWFMRNITLYCMYESIQTVTDLDSTCGPRGALSNVEEASTSCFGLAVLAGCASSMDDHRFALEQTHQMGRFLTLCHSHLSKLLRWIK